MILITNLFKYNYFKIIFIYFLLFISLTIVYLFNLFDPSFIYLFIKIVEERLHYTHYNTKIRSQFNKHHHYTIFTLQTKKKKSEFFFSFFF